MQSFQDCFSLLVDIRHRSPFVIWRRTVPGERMERSNSGDPTWHLYMKAKIWALPSPPHHLKTDVMVISLHLWQIVNSCRRLRAIFSLTAMGKGKWMSQEAPYHIRLLSQNCIWRHLVMAVWKGVHMAKSFLIRLPTSIWQAIWFFRTPEKWFASFKNFSSGTPFRVFQGLEWKTEK